MKKATANLLDISCLGVSVLYVMLLLTKSAEVYAQAWTEIPFGDSYVFDPETLFSCMDIDHCLVPLFFATSPSSSIAVLVNTSDAFQTYNVIPLPVCNTSDTGLPFDPVVTYYGMSTGAGVVVATNSEQTCDMYSVDNGATFSPSSYEPATPVREWIMWIKTFPSSTGATAIAIMGAAYSPNATAVMIIAVSYNNGNSFQMFPLPSKDAYNSSSNRLVFVSAAFPDPRTWYIVGASDFTYLVVLKTTDAGNSFTQLPIAPSLPMAISDSVGNNNIACFDANDCFVCAGSVIYRTLDGGANWKVAANYTTSFLHLLQIVDDTTIVAAGQIANGSNYPGIVYQYSTSSDQWTIHSQYETSFAWIQFFGLKYAYGLAALGGNTSLVRFQ